MRKLRPWAAALLAIALLGAWAPAPKPPEDARTLDKLAYDLSHGQEYRRVMAVDMLGRIGGKEAVGLLIGTMLEDRSKPVRRAAQRQLAGVTDERLYPAILDALKDSNRERRRAAIDALSLVRDPSAAVALLEASQTHARDTEDVRLSLEAIRDLVYRLEPPPGFENELEPYLEHRDRRIRLTAAIILGILGRPDTLPALLRAWDRSGWNMQVRLADAFAAIGHVDPVGRLVEALRDRHKDLRLHALYALAQIQSFTALEPIRDLLIRQRDPRVSMAALYALVEIPDADSIPVILDLLETRDDPTTLHWAAYALGQLHAVAAVPELQDLLNHGDVLVRSSAASALGEIGDRAAAPALRERVADTGESPEVQIAAIQALMRLGDTEAAEVFTKRLEDESLPLGLRLTLALGLGRLGMAAENARLEKELDSNDFTLAFSAAVALGARGDPRAAAPLIDALDHGYPQIRRYAILGLEGLNDPAARKALADTANDDRDELVRILCASSLVAAGYSDYRVVLWNALDEKDEDLRSEAVIALGRSADDLVLTQLKWYLRREPSIPVRQAIQRVLREHGR